MPLKRKRNVFNREKEMRGVKVIIVIVVYIVLVAHVTLREGRKKLTVPIVLKNLTIVVRMRVEMPEGRTEETRGKKK